MRMLAVGMMVLGALGAWGETPLPDPLVLNDGTAVTTAEQWYAKRRPEIVEMVQRYEYGFAPEAGPITFATEAPDVAVYGGKGTLRQVAISMAGVPEDGPKLHLAIFLPNNGKERHPVFLGINKCGNLGVSTEAAVIYNPKTYVHKECPAGGEGCRGFEAEAWSVPLFLERGYALATFHESDVDADEPDSDVGVQKYFPDLPYPEDEQWATIRTWAWGFSRCVDYLVQDAQIDPKRIAVTGHSRRGKTSLLAAAMDTRVSLAAPHQSGTGGTALCRDNDQETVKRINTVFPHWFDGKFKEYNDNEAALPMDQHFLEALIAPRALIDTQGLQDKWANGTSGLRALHAADPVYKLLGARGAVGEGVLTSEAITQENAGNLLQYRLDMKHQIHHDFWVKVLDFADLVWGKE